MIGSLTKCIAEFLRSTEVVKENNIPVYTANTVEGRFTVNTLLPAILITVAPSEDPTVFISGNILDSINIHIRYMDDLLNYTMSEDDGIYEDRRDWAYQLRDELWNNKQSTYFKQFMNVNGLNIMYKGMTTYTQVGVLENLSKDIDVFSFIFSCNLFSDQLSSFPTVPLQEFFITLQGAHGERPDPGLVTVTASGEKFPVWNTVQGSDKIKSLSIHGKSYQNGEATPLSPIEIQSVGDNTITLQTGDSENGVSSSIDIRKSLTDALSDGILRSVNGIYDEVVYNGKEWKLIQRIQNDRIITCTGVSNHVDKGFCDCYFYPTKAPINGSTPNGLLSTHFVHGNNGVGTINLNNNSPYLGIFRYPTTVNMTKEEITAWLGENDVYVSYQLAEPAEYPLDLPVIPTYDNQTWISTVKDDLNPRIVTECEVTEIFDYIRDGLVAYYTGRGRSNTDTNRDILPDLSGNGNDLENKNFAYTPESGYGDGYIQYDGVDDYSMRENPIYDSEYDMSTICVVCSGLKGLDGTVVNPFFTDVIRGVALNSVLDDKYIDFTGLNTTTIYNNYFNTTEFKMSNEIQLFDSVNMMTCKFKALSKPNIYIGQQKYIGGEYGKSRVHDVLFYTRGLSAEEIEHNYKASQQFNGMTL